MPRTPGCLKAENERGPSQKERSEPGPSHGGTVRENQKNERLRPHPRFSINQVFKKLASKVGAVRCLRQPQRRGSMENNNNNNISSSHVVVGVALPACSAPRLCADGSTSCDQSYTRASAAAQVVAGASSPQAPAQQHSTACKLDGCSDAAMFVFEGDALGSYCQVHKPIMGPVEARTQVSGVRRDREMS